MEKKYFVLEKIPTFKLTLFVVILNCLFANAKESTLGAPVSTNGGSGLSLSYSSLAAAVTALNAATITSPVIITLNNNETAPAGGYSVTAQGDVVNTIIIQGFNNSITVTASAALTVGNINDAIFKLVGADYVTIRNFTMQENPANTVNTPVASNNMTEWGIAVLYATTTNGAQNNTIRGNTITLNRTYTNTFGIYSNSTHADATPTTSASATTATGSNTGLSILANVINNVNLGIAVVGPLAAADYNQSLTIGSSGLGNTIADFGTGIQLSAYANVSATGYGILVRNTANYDVNYNTIASSNGGYTSTTAFRGIFIPSFSISPTGILSQNINNNSVSLRPGASATMTCIEVQGTTGNATTSISISNNDINNTTHTVATATLVTFILNASITQNTNINGNTFTNLSINTSGSVTFISNSVTRLAGAICNVNNNSVVTAFNKTVGGGTVLFYNSFSLSTATVTSETNSGNNFSNMTFTGATTITGWRCGDGTTTAPYGPTKIVTNNTFSNIVCGTSAAVMLEVDYGSATGNSVISNNTISNISGAGNITGLLSAQGKQSITGNTITGITTTGTTVIGMSITQGTNQDIAKNKMGNLEANNAAGVVSAINVSGGVLVSIVNNLIGDLRTPIKDGAADGVRAINLTSTTVISNINIYNNTINLNAVSTGTDFSSSGIFHTTNATATTAALDLRNNIIVNTSVANGTGTSVALRRSSTALNNFAATSNNNDLIAPILFSDGTNIPVTLAAYQTLATPRDTASLSVVPNFLSTTIANVNYLHINTTILTPIESGGSAIAAVISDFDGDIRQGVGGYVGTGTAPDMGADEFEGISLGTATFNESNFNFYPNPTSGILNISSSRAISEITVMDLLGQMVTNKKTNDLDVQIDLSSLSRAAYLVRVVTDGQEKIIKILKR